MSNLRSCRSQADMIQRDVSKASAVKVFGASKTRQEFRGDCDVNTVVRRYATGDIPLKPVQYGEQDMNMDATTAHLMMREVGEIFQQLPKELRSKYPTIVDLARALKRGEVKVSDKSMAEANADAAAARQAEFDLAVKQAAPAPKEGA